MQFWFVFHIRYTLSLNVTGPTGSAICFQFNTINKHLFAHHQEVLYIQQMARQTTWYDQHNAARSMYRLLT
jgi:hypothetical protein